MGHSEADPHQQHACFTERAQIGTLTLADRFANAGKPGLGLLASNQMIGRLKRRRIVVAHSADLQRLFNYGQHRWDPPLYSKCTVLGPTCLSQDYCPQPCFNSLQHL